MQIQLQTDEDTKVDLSNEGFEGYDYVSIRLTEGSKDMIAEVDLNDLLAALQTFDYKREKERLREEYLIKTER